MKNVFKRTAAAVLSAAMVLCSGCINGGAIKTISDGNTVTDAEPFQQTSAQEQTSAPEITVAPDISSALGEGRSTLLSVSGESFDIIRRIRDAETEADSSGAWTIFVYLCGTDLESEYGCATEEFKEMVEGVSNENLRFVIETDGTEKWKTGFGLKGERKYRIVIDKSGFNIVDELSSTNMGDPSTLQNFLEWGLANYTGERMGLILWNHGGGSASGVCFDEMYYSDSLLLSEIDSALTSVYGKMNRKFDFIGFDACLMATVEAANILVPHAEYMYASQELEEGFGWDYKTIGEYLCKNGAAADGKALGKVVCDSYMEVCEEYYSGYADTMSSVDLTQLDSFLKEFNSFCSKFYQYASDSANLPAIVRSMKNEVEFYGGNNDTEGYTNMVDLGNLIEVAAEAANIDASGVLRLLKDCVSYKNNGSAISAGCGMSVYYPLSVQGTYEVNIMKNICVSPYYLSFIDLVMYSGGNAGVTDGYDYNQWTEDGGFWSDYEYDTDQGVESGSDCEDCSAIEYLVEPYLTDDGSYQFMLTEDSMYYLETVYCNLCMAYTADDGRDLLLDLGTDDYVTIDWETGTVKDAFSGYWFALPDGQPIAAFLIEINDDYNIYTVPIYLNDNFTYLRIKLQYTQDDYYIEMLGTWNGVSDSGSTDRDLRELQPGDVICPYYDAYYADTYEYYDCYYGNDWVYDGNREITESFLDEGQYYYCFEIEDIFGNMLYTDYVLFGVGEDGGLMFYPY